MKPKEKREYSRPCRVVDGIVAVTRNGNTWLVTVVAWMETARKVAVSCLICQNHGSAVAFPAEWILRRDVTDLPDVLVEPKKPMTPQAFTKG